MPSKCGLIRELKPSRLHITLYYHDSIMLQFEAECGVSLSPVDPIVKFDCGFTTLSMATKYRIECISSDGKNASYIEHNYLE